ncbi:hypothetical protein SISNIDRAFT_488167 [Sistotremastrum niveocremeum HHB9708]|uniref:HAT C-terminal dimerisation domain-containing protein n=1 Tax=Sistotremastrum niveocremeum HHB9708 TaxID=1314777 RepID=A0A164RIQ7_9AGAM|nr:hypothetical protein SISNIDRAFT_488167 [Sistotremastrum niveocremeum HHB9708]
MSTAAQYCQYGNSAKSAHIILTIDALSSGKAFLTNLVMDDGTSPPAPNTRSSNTDQDERARSNRVALYKSPSSLPTPVLPLNSIDHLTRSFWSARAQLRSLLGAHRGAVHLATAVGPGVVHGHCYLAVYLHRYIQGAIQILPLDFIQCPKVFREDELSTRNQVAKILRVFYLNKKLLVHVSDALPPWHNNYVTERLRHILLPDRRFPWTVGPHSLCFEKLCDSTARVLFSNLIQELSVALKTEYKSIYPSTETDRAICDDETFLEEAKLIIRKALRDMSMPLLSPGDPFWVKLVLHDLKKAYHVRSFSDYCEVFDAHDVFDELEIVLLRFTDLAAAFANTDSQYILAYQVHCQVDALKEALQQLCTDLRTWSPIRNACQVALGHLVASYNPLNPSFIFGIMTILDPRLKTVYLQQHGWDDEKTDSLVEYCRKIWDLNYRSMNQRSAKIALSPENLARNSYMDAFQIYITSPPDPKCWDPLVYWERVQASGLNYGLSQMAIDYLSIPATVRPTAKGFGLLYRNIRQNRECRNADTIIYKTLLDLWKESGVLSE